MQRHKADSCACSMLTGLCGSHRLIVFPLVVVHCSSSVWQSHHYENTLHSVHAS